MRWILKIGLFCLLSCLAIEKSSAEEAIPPSKFHSSIGTGVGLSYDGLGVRLELRKAHWAASIGLGLDALPSTQQETGGTLHRSFFNSLGLAGRWFSGDGRGLMLALSIMATWDYWQSPYFHEPHPHNKHLYIAPMVGY